MKKVLIITGSPKKGGNTDTLANRFADIAEQNGAQVSFFRAADHKIAPCLACDQCFSEADVPCIQQDGMKTLYPLFLEADIIVFASPLYYYSWTAQIKSVWDRFYAYSSKAERTKGKKTVLLSAGGDVVEQAFDGIRRSFELSSEFLEWEIVGEVLVLEAETHDFVQKTGKGLEEVEILAKKALEIA